MFNKLDMGAYVINKNLELFTKHNVGDEWQWLIQAAVDIDSPITFTHIDFRPPNILVTETDGIVLCDFEYSCYGFRGFDFGTIFLEWGRDRKDWNTPYAFPEDDSTIKPLMQIYIEESVRLRGKEFSDDPRNSLEHIMREVKVFSLVAIMWVILFKLSLDDDFIAGVPFTRDTIMV